MISSFWLRSCMYELHTPLTEHCMAAMTMTMTASMVQVRKVFAIVSFFFFIIVTLWMNNTHAVCPVQCRSPNGSSNSSSSDGSFFKTKNIYIQCDTIVCLYRRYNEQNLHRYNLFILFHFILVSSNSIGSVRLNTCRLPACLPCPCPCAWACVRIGDVFVCA